MFDVIDIKLHGPICDCDKDRLGWGFISKSLSLIIYCKECDVSVIIPYKKLKATITLEKPYPNEKNELKDNKNNLVVLNFENKEDE